MPKKSDYYSRQLLKTLPIDEYGIAMKIKSPIGETNWLQINMESMKDLINFYNNEIAIYNEDKIKIL